MMVLRNHAGVIDVVPILEHRWNAKPGSITSLAEARNQTRVSPLELIPQLGIHGDMMLLKFTEFFAYMCCCCCRRRRRCCCSGCGSGCGFCSRRCCFCGSSQHGHIGHDHDERVCCDNFFVPSAGNQEAGTFHCTSLLHFPALVRSWYV